MGHESTDPEGRVGGASSLSGMGQTLAVPEILMRTRSRPQEGDLGLSTSGPWLPPGAVSERILVGPWKISQG